MSNEASPAVRVDGVSKSFGGAVALEPIRMHIRRGEFLTLLGPSGCGKTTLLRTIAGFLPAANGAISFGARDVTRLPAHKRNIGMVFQDYALFPDKTVFENVAYGLRARGERGAGLTSRVERAMDRVGLAAFGARKPAALSGGQRQRVALARALVIEPEVLLMDEPLSNLDAKLRVQVRETIMELQREARITTVFVTHDQEEALSMSDMIGVMNKGRLEQIGTPQQVYATPATGYVADFVGAANRIAVTLDGSPEGGVQAVRLGERALRGQCTAPVGAPGGAAHLVVRPEDIGLAATSEAAAPGLPAQVLQRQYLGSKTTYKLRLADSDAIITAELHGEAHDRFTIGQEVAVAISPDTALVLAP